MTCRPQGAYSRSHGVNVARIAGLPESILSRAEAKSKELEGVLEAQYERGLHARLQVRT